MLSRLPAAPEARAPPPPRTRRTAEAQRSFERSESIPPPAARSADVLRTTMKAWRKTGQVRAGGWGTHSGLCLAWLEPSLKRRTSRYFYRGWKIDVSPGQVGYRLCHFLPGTLTSYGQPYGLLWQREVKGISPRIWTFCMPCSCHECDPALPVAPFSYGDRGSTFWWTRGRLLAALPRSFC